MRCWYLLVLGLYALALLGLSVPLLWTGYGWGWFGVVKDEASLPQVLGILGGEGAPWLAGWIVLMLLAQILLLAVPVALTRQRPVRQRSVWTTVLASGFCMALLAWLFLIDLYVLVDGGEGKGTVRLVPGLASAVLWCTVAVALGVWGIWARIFYRMWRPEGGVDWMAQICRFLLAGSILELLVAVPCHVASRHRNDCCAHLGTFLGIVAGTSVMLLSFGPGVLFLFAERMRRKKGSRPIQ